MKKTWIISSIVILLLVVILTVGFIYRGSLLKESKRVYTYMDTEIIVKVYTANKMKGENALDKVGEIYETYHNLTNKYEEYENGLYNLNMSGNSPIDSRLYDMISYGYSWYEKSNHLLNIAIGNVTDIWKEYREKGSGVPTLKELQKVSIDMDDIHIDNNRITLTNGVTIDLGAISKGYTTELVANYLDSIGIHRYLINAGGNVYVGKRHTKNPYKIGIENPNGEDVYKVIKGENIAVVTSGSYRRNYTYDGVTYNHIIDPNTLFPANNMLSVTVISKSSKEADALSTILFLMDEKEGLEFIKDYDVEVIWYLNDGTIKMTDGITKYE